MATSHELTDAPAACAERVAGDALLAWAAGDHREGVRVWASGGAVAVAAPGLARRDRLAVGGDPASAVDLVRVVLDVLPTSFRPIGDAALIRQLVSELPNLEMVAEFGWMDVVHGTFRDAPTDDARWLGDADMPAVAQLLAIASPTAYAQPKLAGVQRWAGVEAQDGTLRSVAADAWSCALVGFVSSLATHPDYRRRGAARAVTSFVVREMLIDHAKVALLVDSENHAARTLYESFGMHWRAVASARVRAL